MLFQVFLFLEVIGPDHINALALFRENEYPDTEEIKEYLAGNLCRCSGYEGQLRGIQAFLEWKKEKNGKEAAEA